MMLDRKVRLRRWSWAFGSSLAAMAAASASPASAQCTPDPTVTNGTTNCTGTDSDGLSVTATGANVVVAAGATVLAGSSAAAITTSAAVSTITVNGRVDGGSKTGLFATTASPYSAGCDPYAGASPSSCSPGSTLLVYPSANTTISVGKDGVITGAQAILAQRAAGSPNAFIVLSLTNSGRLTGTAGPAVLLLDTGSQLASISNLAGGWIGGIAGTAGSVYNYGTIDGGANSAIAATGSSISVTNNGTILSGAGVATISGTGTVGINNAAGATIGGGTVAIRAGGALNLTNLGTINGSVVSTAAAGPSSTIDTSQGIINGDLTLGAGNDTLRARYDVTTGKIASITGVVDGGAGTDTLTIAVDKTLTLGSAVLPTNFEVLGLDISNNAAVTLSPAFPNIGVSGNGNGSLINQAVLTTSGPAITSAFAQALSVTNQAAITATLTQSTQYAVGTPGRVINNGTITAIGGGGVQAYTLLTNNGAIIATGTAANVSIGTFTNSGTIRSSGGIGAMIQSQGYYVQSANSGTIQGASYGVRVMNGQLVNDGMLTGGTAGIALDYGGGLVNNAGGVVTGGVNGVQNVGSSALVVNAGTINGNVNLASALSFDSSTDVFVDKGGTVNGAILLGGGDDQLVVDLAAAGGRPLAGATGGVDAGAGYDTIHYRVKADASADLALPGTFEGLAYELDNGAALTLTAQQPISTTIGLSGNGTVALNGSISTNDRTLLDLTALTADQLTGAGTGPTRALSVVNNGTLTITGDQLATSSQLYAVNAGTADFTNNGTIAVRNSGGGYYTVGGILSGNNVTNTGTIKLGGGTAIANATNIVNTGAITDVAGTGGNGILTFTNLDNSGTIRVDQTAVLTGFYSSTITNSGTIESRLGSAVSLAGGYGSTLINQSTGSIGGKVSAVQLSGGLILNQGTIVGDISSTAYPYLSEAYVADGGTVAGNVTFGSSNDVFVQVGVDGNGVSGTVDGGSGEDVYGYALKSSGTVSLDAKTGTTGFEDRLVQAAGSDTTATITASAPFAGVVYLSGDGKIVNQATLTGSIRAGLLGALGQSLSTYDYTVNDFVNEGALGGDIQGAFSSFTNKGTISSTVAFAGPALTSKGALSFDNSGQISLSGTVSLNAVGALSVTNSGSIESQYVAMDIAGNAGSISVDNSGTIKAGAGLGGSALRFDIFGDVPSSIAITNSGSITATGTTSPTLTYGNGITLFNGSGSAATATITNTASGVIAATGYGSTGISAYNVGLTINNAGTISGGTSNPYSGAAISVGGAQATQIINSGTITGTVSLGGGDDLIENRGTIDGNVFLGDGNDIFRQLAGTVTGRVDGGNGFDTLVVDTSQSGTIDSSRFVNFERYTQTGAGNATYNGNFNAQNFGISGGGMTVAQGSTLTSTDAVTIAGSGGSEQVTNAGTISGTIDLGGGADTVVNRGTIGGTVLLGDGDDSFTDGAGSSVAGGVDGGTGNNSYVVELSGDRTGIGARRNFQTLDVTGNGTLTLTLDQSWQQIILSGNNLNLALGGFSVVSLTGGAGAEQVVVDGDIANVALGGGDDRLTLGSATLAGHYDGGDGTNVLTTTASAPIRLTGTLANFSVIDTGGQALSVAGSLIGAAGGTVLAGTGHDVSFESGSIIAGDLSLGAGANTLHILAGANVGGTIKGGDGSGPASLQIANDGGTLAIAANLSGFDAATLAGGGTVQVNGAWTLGTLGFDGNLTVGSGGALTATSVAGNANANVVTLSGRFAGALDLGAGNDTLRLTGAPVTSGTISGGADTDTIELAVSGTDAAPTSFAATSFTNFEALKAQSGVAILGGTQTFNTVDVGAGARLIGAAGSIFTASQFTVAAGGTFGTAGIVNGNVAVAGTLSPGASPGTMTVNGNVSLASGSKALFEMTSAVSDKLVISGTLNIASGSTLALTGNRPLTPGVTLDLIVANGGITGSFTTVNQDAGVGGFLSQSGDRISLLGTFLTSQAFSPQVNRTIDGVNNLLISGKAGAAVLAGVPKLIVGGATDAAAFARISPEPFASATALALEDGLSLIDATRNQARSAPSSTGLFTFAQMLGTRYRIGGDAAQGTNAARISGSGGFAGIGFGSDKASIGGFVGYGESHQSIAALGSSLHGNGAIAGIQANLNAGGFTLAALGAYSERSVTLRRSVPQGSAQSDFHLRDLIGDLTAAYSLPMGDNWAIRPRVGLSYVHAERGKAAETGSSPFVLQLGSGGIGNWFADGGIDLAGTAGRLRPFVGVALRERLNDRHKGVDATFVGTDVPITALGATSGRSSVLANAGASFELTRKLSLSAAYTGAFSHNVRHTGTVGLRYIM